MSTGQKIRFAGDVSIERVRITTSKGFYLDVTAQTIAIQYYEDIFSPFISGSIILKESFDFTNLFPLIGEEYLDLEIITPTLDDQKAIRGTYYIYKMTDKEALGDKSSAYQLHFMSTEAIVDMNKKVSGVFGDRVSQLIRRFITDKTNGLESTKQVFIEETSNSTKYVSNFWSPAKNLIYLTNQATNLNNIPNYVFFENRDGFYFVSLDTLYTANVYQEFTYDKYTRDSDGMGGDIKNVDADYKRISNFSIPVHYDYIDKISSGMLASKLITYDVTTKKYTAKNYNMFSRFDKQKHLNKNAINTDSVPYRTGSNIMVLSKQWGNFNGFGDVTNTRFIQERVSTLKAAESSKLHITVPGRTDYTVGQKMAIYLNRMEPISSKKEDTLDRALSGYYILAAVNHYIDREKHECHMELIRESSQMDMNTGK
jgi:hypothetical protein